MQTTVRALSLLAVVFLCPACRTAPKPAGAWSMPASALLTRSAHRLVGRVIGVDANRHFAIVELAAGVSTVASDVELVVRTDDLRETGRLRSTRQLRGGTLGTRVLSGEPALGDEVVAVEP